MVNDDHNILLGLYRECDLCESVESTKESITKKIVIDDVQYTLTETIIGRKFIWKIFSNGIEMSRDEILNLYALAHAKRLLK